MPKVKEILHLDGVKSLYAKYEGLVGSATILVGFIVDNLVLRVASITTQTLTFSIYLFLTALAILLLNYIESKEQGKMLYSKIHFWTFLGMQFVMGGLFSMFFVFYSRGVSISASWPFLLFLLVNMIGSEFFKKKYSRLGVQISLLFISIFSFSIYFLPVLVHRINAYVFVASGILSLFVAYLFIWLVAFVAKSRVKAERKSIFGGVLAVYLLINIFYVLNVIPPVPLVMKEGGVYHSISFQAGSYVAEGEVKPWWGFFIPYPVYHHTSGDPIYVAVSVYAPAALDTTIVHDWQFLDPADNSWKSVTKIPVGIVGGKESGYRSYSEKQNVVPGLWRVDMETADGKIIGRIKFKIVEDNSTPNLVEDVY